MTKTEKNFSRLAGIVLGLVAVLSLLWVSRPVAKDPSMGTEVSVRIQRMDGIRLVSEGATVMPASELRAGGPGIKVTAKLESIHPEQSLVRWQFDQATSSSLSENPAADLVWMQVGEDGEFGQAPLSEFAGSDVPAAWVPSGRFSIPITVWVPQSAGHNGAALFVDLTLVPETIGYRR